MIHCPSVTALVMIHCPSVTAPPRDDSLSFCYCTRDDSLPFCYCTRDDSLPFCYCTRDDSLPFCYCTRDDSLPFCYCTRDDSLPFCCYLVDVQHKISLITGTIDTISIKISYNQWQENSILWVMVFNATFNSISFISWWSVLLHLVEVTGVPGENTDVPQVTDKLYHIMLSRVHIAMNNFSGDMH